MGWVVNKLTVRQMRRRVSWKRALDQIFEQKMHLDGKCLKMEGDGRSAKRTGDRLLFGCTCVWYVRGWQVKWQAMIRWQLGGQWTRRRTQFLTAGCSLKCEVCKRFWENTFAQRWMWGKVRHQVECFPMLHWNRKVLEKLNQKEGRRQKEIPNGGAAQIKQEKVRLCPVWKCQNPDRADKSVEKTKLSWKL